MFINSCQMNELLRRCLLVLAVTILLTNCQSLAQHLALVDDAVFEKRVDIYTVPEGAQLYINGSYIGNSPQRLNLAYSGPETWALKAVPSVSGFYVTELQLSVPQVPDQVTLYLDHYSGQRVSDVAGDSDPVKDNSDDVLSTMTNKVASGQPQYHRLLQPSLYFDHNQSALAGRYLPLLKQWAQMLRASGHKHWVLHAYADDSGSHEYNQRLSAARARVVLTQLMALGVDCSTLGIVAHGERRGADMSQKSLPRKFNRAVELLYQPQLWSVLNIPSQGCGVDLSLTKTD